MDGCHSDCNLATLLLPNLNKSVRISKKKDEAGSQQGFKGS